MSDDTTQPTPADLARELIRRIDAMDAIKDTKSDEWFHAAVQQAELQTAHGRTIAEALLAAEGYIATLELANGGNKDHIAAIEGQLLAAERRVAELEGACVSVIPLVKEVADHVGCDCLEDETGFIFSKCALCSLDIALAGLAAVLAKGAKP